MNPNPSSKQNPETLNQPPGISCLPVLFVSVMLLWLWIAKWQGMIAWPWPAVVGLTFAGLFLIRLSLSLGKFTGALPVISAEAARQAFSNSSQQRLRCLSFRIPRNWQVEKLASGAFRLHVHKLKDLTSINVEVVWLWTTEINTVEGYKEYAVKFVCDKLRGQMLRNEITTRWGTPAHEFEYTGKHSTGWKVTIPYHGTEYGMHVMTKFAAMYPGAKLVFEEFLKHCQLVPPQLQQHSVFNGTLTIGLPPAFRFAEQTPDTFVWSASHPLGAKFTLRRFHLPSSVPLTKDVLAPFAADRLRPAEPFGCGPFSMNELGIAGFQTFEATPPGPNARTRFVAAVELLTGGRYLIVLEDRDPAQARYEEGFHYVQMGMEIIATMSE